MKLITHTLAALLLSITLPAMADIFIGLTVPQDCVEIVLEGEKSRPECARIVVGPEAQAVIISKTLARCSDGTYRTSNPLGDCGASAADLDWDLSALENTLSLAGAYSDDLRACCLSGNDAATATLTLETCSGDDAAANGWAINTDDLENAGTDGDLPGSGAMAFRATQGADSALSSCQNWSYVTAPTGDTLAPPIPTGLIITGTDTDEVSIAFDASCDNHDGAESGSGTAQYNVEIDGGSADTVTATDCTTSALTETILGGNDGTPDSTQTGNSWDLSFGGTGVDSTSDQVLLRGTSLSGDVTTIASVTAIASAASFDKTGIYARGSLDADAIACYTYYLDAATPKVQMRCRTQAGAATSTVATQTAPSLPVYIKTFRNQSANTLTSYYSADGGAWTQLASLSIDMPSTVQSGVFVTSSSAGTNATGTVANVNIHALPTVARDVSTTVGGTFTVGAQDGEGNISADSASVSGDPDDPEDPPPPGAGKKWNPGWYVKTQGQHCQSNETAYVTDMVNQINSHVPSSGQLEGALLRIAWGAIERSPGVYSFDRIHTILNASGLAGKSLGVEIEHKCFGHSQNAAALMPPDLEDEVNTTNTGIIARYWDADVMDRIIAMMEAFAEEFDDNARIEYVSLGSESCPSFGSNAPADYSHAAALTQSIRLYEAQKNAFPNTNVFAAWNCSQGNIINQGAEEAYQRGLGLSGPDTHATAGNSVFDGSRTGAVRDYRTLSAHLGTLSAPNLGGKDDVLPLSSWQSTFINGNKFTHVGLVMSSNASGGTKTDILNHINAGGGSTNNTYEGCPTRYTQIAEGCQ
jgi:hypothetical protein